MKKWAFLFLLVYQYGLSQTLAVNIECEKAINARTFLVKKGNAYTTVELEVKYSKADRAFVTELVPGNVTGTREEVIKAAQLKELADFNSGSANQMMAQLNSTVFTYPADTLHTHSFINRKAFFYNGNYNYASLEEQSILKDSKKKLRPNEPVYSFFKVVPVVINDTYTILALFNTLFSYNDYYKYNAGYAYSYKTEFYLSFKHLRGKHLKGAPATANKPKGASNIMPKGEIKQVSGKYGVYETGLDYAFIPSVYDTIINSHTFYIGKTGSRIDVIAANGTVTSNGDIKATYTSPAGTTTAIAGNKIQYVLADGSFTEERPLNGYDGCGTVPHITRAINIKEGYYICTETTSYGGITVREYKLCPTTGLKDLDWFNGTKQDEYLSLYSFEAFNTLNCFIITLPDGKKGMVRINYQLPAPFAETVLPPGNYTFNNKDWPYLFEESGLKNYLAVSRTPRYTQLGKVEKYSFARFTLPNGKQGWLAMDGKEYLDE